MAKLSSKERKDLDTEVFGLPKKRKFPLTDIEHVYKAIQFFKFAKPGERSELSNNINKRAKELGITLKISKSSPYYHYADKSIVKESAYDDFQVRQLSDELQIDVESMLNKIFVDYKKVLGSYENTFFLFPTFKSIYIMEKKLRDLLWNNKDFEKIRNSYESGEHSINAVGIVNKIMEKVYDMYFRYLMYNEPNVDIKNTRMLNDIISDIFKYLTAIANKCTCSDKCNCSNIYVKYFEILKTLIKSFGANSWMICRKTEELLYGINILIHSEETDVHTDKRLMTLASVTFGYNKDFIGMSNQETAPYYGVFNNKEILKVLSTSDLRMYDTEAYLRTLKNEMKSQIDIILLTEELAPNRVRDEEFSFINFIANGMLDERGKSLLCSLESGGVRKENITYYNKNFSLDLDSNDLFKINSMNLFKRIYAGKDYCGENVYYGYTTGLLYIIAKDVLTGDLILVELYDENKDYDVISTMLNLTSRCYNDFNTGNKINYLRVTFKHSSEDLDFNILTEGIHFDKDGTIKFSFKPKKSYMDEYSENHAILIQNFKSGNYEDMKSNLAFLFAMINEIERKVIHSKKSVKDDLRKDAEKARMFAINDFKTYLKKLQSKQPKFNFTDFYSKSDYGKITFGIKHEDIIGIKRLFQTIILK